MTKDTTVPMAPNGTGVFDDSPTDTAYRVACALYNRGTTDFKKVGKAVGVPESLAREWYDTWRTTEKRKT